MGVGTMTQLPKGFVLDEPAPTVQPALPEGFVLDEAQASEVAPEGEFSEFDSAVLGMANGLLQNFGAEAAGVIGGIIEGLGREEGFNAARKRVAEEAAAMLKQAEEQNPKSFGGGEIGGAIGTSIVPGAAALKGGTALTKGAKLAGAGAAQGAVFGAGEDGDLEQRSNAAAKGAAFGAVTGALVPAAGAGVGKLVSKVLSKRGGVPSVEDIRGAATALYQKSKSAGVVVKPARTDAIIDDLNQLATKEGAVPGVADPVLAALKHLETNRGTQASFEDFDLMRRVIRNAVGTDPSNNRIAGELINRLDDHLDRLKPLDMVSGVTRQKSAIKDLKNARALWKRLKKSEIIEEALQRAENQAGGFSQSGMENAVRTQFKRIADNKRLFRQFDKAEQEGILQVVRGTKTQTLLRGLGKLAPRGPVSFIANITAGTAVGGPLGAGAGVATTAGLAAVGEVARKAATKARLQSAKSVDEMVRFGGAPPKSDNALAQSVTGRGLIGTAAATNDDIPIEITTTGDDVLRVLNASR